MSYEPKGEGFIRPPGFDLEALRASLDLFAHELYRQHSDARHVLGAAPGLGPAVHAWRPRQGELGVFIELGRHGEVIPGFLRFERTRYAAEAPLDIALEPGDEFGLVAVLEVNLAYLNEVQ